MVKEYVIYNKSRRIILSTTAHGHFKRTEGFFFKYDHPEEITKLLVFFQTVPKIQNLLLIHDDIELLLEEVSKHYNLVEAAGGLVHNTNGEYLLILRNGLWDLPKGKGEANEKPEATAIREVSEECGITSLTIEKPLLVTYHTYNEGDKSILKKTHWFNMIYSGMEALCPQGAENIADARWIPPTELPHFLGETYGSIRDVFKTAGLT